MLLEKNTVFGDATTGEYLGEFELFALHWCAASGLFGYKNQQTPFPTSNSVASHRIFFLSAAFGSLIQSHWPDCQQNVENTNITLHVMCLSSQGTIWATPLLDAASGLLLPSSPSNTYLGLHPGSGNQVSPKLKVGIHKIYIELILEVSTSSKVC